jgi:hypothetical protein
MTLTLPIRHLPVALLLVLTCFSESAFASGSYTSSGSRALAGSNTAGDVLIAGDLKMLLIRGDRNYARNLQRPFPAEQGIVTGGLVERSTSAGFVTFALICSQTIALSAKVDDSKRVAFRETDLREALKLTGPRDLRCAVNPQNGEWIAVNLKNGAAILHSSADSSSFVSTALTLPRITGRWTHVVYTGQSFFAFSDNGIAAGISAGGPTRAGVQLNRAPWADLEPRDTVVSSGSSVLKVGQGRTAIAQLDTTDSIVSWINHTKININPCSDNGGCGAWIGPDQRWIVAGTWGTYTGVSSQFTRLKVPLVMSESTSAGAALNPARNQFVLVGDTEAEIGTLPPLPDNTNRPNFSLDNQDARKETRRAKTNRYAIWLKGRVKELAEHFPSAGENPKVLFTYLPNSSLQAIEGEVIVGSGRIPDPLPAHWAAVEPQVEFDPIVMANEWSPAERSAQPLPSAKAWWSDAIGLGRAVAELKKSKLQPSPMKVAVIDSGVDVGHPALQGAFAVNSNEIDGNGTDDDGNGLVDDVIGYDFVREKPSIADEFGHGTHVAGLLKNTWSGDALLGGAFNARLKIFRALDEHGKSNSIDLSRAVSAAIQDGADIMNCSWGGGPETQILRDAFAAASRAEMLIFSSAGNDALNTDAHPQVPKKFAGVFSIGAATQSQTRARFSNWGSESVFLFAPGSDILSSLPDGRYGEKSGTSMASPIAASAASLVAGTLRTKHPEWSRAQLNSTAAEILCNSSEKNRLAAPNSKCGSLNAFRAIQMSLGDGP